MPKTASTQANEIFRALLKEARVAKELTQKDVAKLLGLPQSYVSKYESGERRLDFAEAAEVCDALGISFEDFAAVFAWKRAKLAERKGPKK